MGYIHNRFDIEKIYKKSLNIHHKNNTSIIFLKSSDVFYNDKIKEA